MKRFVPRLFLTVSAFLFIATALIPRVTHAETHSLVRYYLDSPKDLEFLRSHPELDIVSVSKRRLYVDIVARGKDIGALRDSGGRFEIIHSELEAYYADRLNGLSFASFRLFSEAVAFMDSLHASFPNVVSEKWSLGQGHEGRDVWCFRLSDNPDLDESEPEILFDGLHHAGEFPSFELPLMLAEYFAQNYGSDTEITHLLNTREIYFVPIVNPDGLVYIQSGAGTSKKNRRDNGDGTFGVDLNRNYPFMWGGAGGSDDSSAENYRGPSPGSEPEVQAIMDLVNSHQFVTHQSYHTPGRVTFYPWSYTSSPSPDAAIFAYMGQMMTQYNIYDHGAVGQIHGIISGVSLDWAYGAKGEHAKVFAFANEIAGQGATEQELLAAIFGDNLWPATYLVRAAAAFVETSDPIISGGDGNGRLDPGESAELSFTLTNQGVITDALGLTITVSSDDPYVQLGSAHRDVGVLSARTSTDFSANPFTIAVDPACPAGRLSEVHVTVNDQGGSLVYTLPLVVGVPVVLFNDDFENGIGAWTTTGDWNTTGSSSHSPSNSMTDSPGGNYGSLTSHSTTLTQGIPATHLSFWHRYEIEDGFDYGYLLASADGIQWQHLATYSGFSAGWTQVQFPLDNYAVQAVQIRFQLDADDVFTEDGWYIDDVTLSGPDQSNETPPPPVLVSPAPGEELKSPVLTVANTTDPDGGGALTYGFRVYGDSLCTNLVASVDDVAQGTGETAWQVPPSLPDTTYWWRAYAADFIERGLMGEKRMFEKNVLVAVFIQRFDARRIETTIHLEWELFADESLAGFNIYRRKGRDGYEAPLNRDGLVSQSDRSFDDTDFEAGQNYYYALGVVRPDGSELRSALVEVRAIAYTFSLGNNYPNPFNPATTIRYSIPKAAHVTLRVYDAQGRLIKSLVNGKKRAGEHTATWNGEDDRGSPVASGVYFARLQSSGRGQARKIVLLK
jgi:hypothetical protein